MTRFASPALHQPELHLTAPTMRALLGAVALVFTAALWAFVGAQAGQFGDRDTAVHVTLDPVVISGRRALPEDPAMAMGAGPAADCANHSVVR